MTVRLAHLSDIHFGDENIAALACATEQLTSEAFDLVVVSGDLTRWAEMDELRAAAAWLSGLPGARLVTPGNHDAPYKAWLQRLFVPFRRYEHLVGPAAVQTHRGDGLAVYGLNTARGAQPRLNWSKGQISTKQTEDACTWIAEAPRSDLRLVVCHHPLVEMIGGPMTGRVWGGPAAARALATAGADVILSGHIHAPFALPLPCADGRTYAVGAGTLSVRERGTPAGFNILEADAEAVRVTALGWTGSRFEPERTWSLDRR
ncbi:metallophosphoesterase [Phenylobacterium sp.]|uniref:metallophosphoesterase family protein n=1 Tax=Phenylobacterium sp. TaxID=1871053 RepID=UPI002F412B23